MPQFNAISLRRLFLPVLCLLFSSLAGTAGAKVWIVDDDGGPGVDFTDIPPAIAAASPEDLILVRDGGYSAFVLDKGVALLADTGHTPDLGANTALVKDIAAGRTAALSGFSMKALTIQDCTGPVQVDDCQIGEAEITAALIIERCARVTVTRSSAVGRNRPFDYGPGGGGGPYARGGAFTDSTVIIADSYFKGGYGSGIYKMGGTDGMDGITIADSTVFVQSTVVVGGKGGDAWDPFEFFGDGGDGAPGIRLENSYLELFGLFEHYVSGGPGGMGDVFIGKDGEDANAVLADFSEVYYSGIELISHSKPPFGGSGSTIVEVSPAVPVLMIHGTGQLGTDIRLELHGPGGSAYLVLLSPFTAVNKVGNLFAHLLLDPGILFPITTGTVAASGLEILDLRIPFMPSLQGMPLHFQAYMKLPGTAPPFLSTSAGFVIR